MKPQIIIQTASAYHPHAATLPATGFLRLPQVLAVFPVCKSSWWAGVKSGKYPKAVKLSQRTTAWKAESIRELSEKTANDVRGV